VAHGNEMVKFWSKAKDHMIPKFTFGDLAALLTPLIE